jgi:2-iminobutanoate/2-iminopropanoate deaminase
MASSKSLQTQPPPHGAESGGIVKYLAILFVVVVLLAGTAAAQDAKSSPTIQRINPATLNKPNGYSHVVIAKGSRMVFIAGQTSSDKNGNVVGKGDFRAQATQAFENLKSALAAAGASFNDVVKLNYYIMDMGNATTLREVRNAYVGNAPPAATLVQVGKLARDEYMLEVEAVAVTK